MFVMALHSIVVTRTTHLDPHLNTFWFCKIYSYLVHFGFSTFLINKIMLVYSVNILDLCWLNVYCLNSFWVFCASVEKWKLSLRLFSHGNIKEFYVSRQHGRTYLSSKKNYFRQKNFKKKLFFFAVIYYIIACWYCLFKTLSSFINYLGILDRNRLLNYYVLYSYCRWTFFCLSCSFMDICQFSKFLSDWSQSFFWYNRHDVVEIVDFLNLGWVNIN